jgi:transporter family-2 protein
VTSTRADAGGPPEATLPPSTAAQRVLGVGLAFLGGVSLAVQSRTNGQLSGQLRDAPLTALISFGGGLALLVLVVPAVPAGRRGIGRLLAWLRDGRLRWWQTLGGVCGAYLVTAQGLTVGVLGVAAFIVAVVAGQVTSGLVVDRMGIGPGGPQAVTVPRVIGALLAVGAVVLSVAGGLGQVRGLWLAVLPAVAGLGTAWQQAVNGRVRGAADNAFVAALVNFAVGTVALAVVVAVELLTRGRPGAAPWAGPWWLYLGGALGIVVIATAAAAVRYIGVLLVGLCSVAGQLVGAVLLDLLVPAHGRHPDTATLVGSAIILVAVLVASLPYRTRG